MRNLILTFAVLAILSGCASFQKTPDYAVKLANIDWPLIELQKLAAFECPTGMRTASENGREFYSKYFVVDNKGTVKPAGDALDRFSAQITVLGDHRPYDIEIFVVREKRILRENHFDYITVGHDVGLARQIEDKIHEELTKRREERNIIDDFRVF